MNLECVFMSLRLVRKWMTGGVGGMEMKLG